jgi:hypothetical protein
MRGMWGMFDAIVAVVALARLDYRSRWRRSP